MRSPQKHCLGSISGYWHRRHKREISPEPCSSFSPNENCAAELVIWPSIFHEIFIGTAEEHIKNVPFSRPVHAHHTQRWIRNIRWFTFKSLVKTASNFPELQAKYHGTCTNRFSTKMRFTHLRTFSDRSLRKKWRTVPRFPHSSTS